MDAMPHLRPALYAVTLWAAACLYLLAVPAPDVPPPDPTGVYISHHGETAIYRVTVTKVGGVYCTSWVHLASMDGRPSYVGRLDAQPGDGTTWKETYRDVPGLLHSRPWTWSVVNERPLAFTDPDVAGWTLTVTTPDAPDF